MELMNDIKIRNYKALIELLTACIKISLTVLCIILIFTFGDYIYLRTWLLENTEPEIPIYEYRSLNIHPSKKETVFGSFSMFQRLSETELIYEIDETSGYHHIISNFGTNLYVCTASCLCEVEEDSEKLRRSSATLSKGIVSIFAALSSTLAYKTAKDQFQNDCVEEFRSSSSSSCSLPSIQVKIDECQPMLEVREEEKDEEKNNIIVDDDDESSSKKEEKDIKVVYRCLGICVQNFDFRNDIPIRQILEEEWDHAEYRIEDSACDKLKLKMRFNFDEVQNEVSKKGGIVGEGGGKDVDKRKKIVTSYFIKNHLDLFCREESMDNILALRPKYKDLKVFISMCVGGREKGEIDPVHEQTICEEFSGGWFSWMTFKLFRRLKKKKKEKIEVMNS